MVENRKFSWSAAAGWLIVVLLTLAGHVSGQENTAAEAGASSYGHRAFAEAPADELRPVGDYRATGRIVRLRQTAAQAFLKMQEAAHADGVELVPISGFRSRDYQAGLFKRAVKRYGGQQAAARWVAPPGHSEHHTGLAIDIGDGARPACDVQLCFEETGAATWLAEHAGEFGFELSFPRGSRQPKYEPWHWRYVGDEASRKVFE